MTRIIAHIGGWIALAVFVLFVANWAIHTP